MDMDDAYANAAHIPGGDEYAAAWDAAAESFRQRMAVSRRARLGIMYGHGTRQALDLFLPTDQPKGLVVFVHGGYWRQSDRAQWSHFAAGPLANGWAVAIPSYDLCPRVRISDITRQVAQAICVAAHEVSGPIKLVGHSAGGHLVARAMATDMLAQDIRERVRHVMPISPLADLTPLIATQMNCDLRLDEVSAKAESPVFQDAPSALVTVWVGADERPAFLDQARWLAEAWQAGLVIDAGRHHFDVINGLADENSRMVQVLLQDAE